MNNCQNGIVWYVGGPYFEEKNRWPFDGGFIICFWI